MPVLINFKICDNAKECNGIQVCSTGALSWDEKKKTIIIDNSKCVNCGKCEKACMVDAIHVARTKDDYNRIKKEIDDDPRKVSDLFIDRYGAQPIHPAFLIQQDKFDSEVVEATKLTAAELFNRDSIMCLLHSIPIKELFSWLDIKYRKVEIVDKSLLQKYKVAQLPALVFFKSGKLIGKIEGYFSNEKKAELVRQIKSIVK